MPGYFADRYAYALVSHPAQLLRDSPAERAHRQLHLDFEGMIRRLVRPTAHLHGWVPDPARPTTAGALYQDLRQRWASHCYATGLPDSVAELADAAAMTWADVFAGSVFFPQPPVFLGANFWDELSHDARRSLVDDFGPSTPIDFFCFILQVHETVHAAQVGEPLLNELVQAALWVDFLDTNDLWAFQIGADGTPLVREHEVVRDHPALARRALAARLDTAVMVDGLAPTDAYVLCCSLADQFNHGVIRYADYLNVVSRILANAGDTEWLLRHAQRRGLRANSGSLLTGSEMHQGRRRSAPIGR